MAILKNAINALDPQPDKKKQITLLLNLLSEMCEQKVEQFTTEVESELRTAGTPENKTIPVTEILATQREYRAYVKDDVGKIAEEVSGAIKKFIAGTSDAILDGISDLVTTGVKAIIGAGQGSQQELSSYYIVVQGWGILRFDIRIWCRSIEAEGITAQIEAALATVAYKSSVDVAKLSLNTFLIAYQGQLSKLGIPESDWEKYLSTAEEVFKKLGGGSSVSSLTQEAITMNVPGQLYGSLWE